MSQEIKNKLHTQIVPFIKLVLQQKTLVEFGMSDIGFLWNISCGRIVHLSCLLVSNSKYFPCLHIILHETVTVQAYSGIIFIAQLIGAQWTADIIGCYVGRR
jgi:hypothetical protein